MSSILHGLWKHLTFLLKLSIIKFYCQNTSSFESRMKASFSKIAEICRIFPCHYFWGLRSVTFLTCGKSGRCWLVTWINRKEKTIRNLPHHQLSAWILIELEIALLTTQNKQNPWILRFSSWYDSNNTQDNNKQRWQVPEVPSHFDTALQTSSPGKKQNQNGTLKQAWWTLDFYFVTERKKTKDAKGLTPKTQKSLKKRLYT